MCVRCDVCDSGVMCVIMVQCDAIVGSIKVYFNITKDGGIRSKLILISKSHAELGTIYSATNLC